MGTQRKQVDGMFENLLKLKHHFGGLSKEGGMVLEAKPATDSKEHVMMERLIINNLGPIKACDIQVNDFMIFNGAQASGKSTVAKSIFFFKNIKNLLYHLILRRMSQMEEDFVKMPLGNRLKKEIRNNFLQIFGVCIFFWTL